MLMKIYLILKYLWQLAGIGYIRTSRPAVPVFYDNDEVFELGKAKVHRLIIIFILRLESLLLLQFNYIVLIHLIVEL